MMMSSVKYTHFVVVVIITFTFYLISIYFMTYNSFLNNVPLYKNNKAFINSKPGSSQAKGHNPVDLEANYTSRKSVTWPSYKGIHILATGRSGSSFLGEVLAQHERVFYLYEPGKFLDDDESTPKIEHNETQLHKYVDLITSMYHCNFENMEIFIKAINQKLLYRQRSRFIPSLSGPDFCDSRYGKCKPITNQIIHEKCKSKEFVIIKTIRISDMLNLAHLVEEADIDFKIVLLIRDPRGVILSKFRAWHPDVVDRMKRDNRSKFDVKDLSPGVYISLDNWCKAWIRNADIGRQSHMVSKFTAVRYEDLSLSPLQLTSDIYGKLGLGEVSDKIKNWLKENTNAKKAGLYSTSRNSSLNVEKWRQSITFELTHRIQELEYCGQFMDKFGYIKVKYPRDLHNSSFSLTGKYYNTA